MGAAWIMSRMLEICLIIMNYFVRYALCENFAENISVQLWRRYASHFNYFISKKSRQISRRDIFVTWNGILVEKY